jgi:cell wall-associated NlpC family hydrolase
VAVVGTSTPASASTQALHGAFTSAWQSRATHQIHVHGLAYDRDVIHRSVKVGIRVDGKWRRTIFAHLRTRVGKHGGLHGRHTFDATLRYPKTAKKVSLVVHPAPKHGGPRKTTDVRWLEHRSTAGEKIVRVAKRYVGSDYVYGAAGPHAFDCSGYAMFVYKKAKVANLPHNSEAQRHARHMHLIKRSAARPGDLVFYMSGNNAYHVSIYAGHGNQYSATDPAQGVRHQKISSSHVQFRTDWH